MNLSDKNYYHSKIMVQPKNGERTEVDQYTYEANNALYDVMRFGKALFVRENSGPWSDRIDAWNRIHYEICNHYGLL